MWSFHLPDEFPGEYDLIICGRRGLIVNGDLEVLGVEHPQVTGLLAVVHPGGGGGCVLGAYPARQGKAAQGLVAKIADLQTTGGIGVGLKGRPPLRFRSW